MVRRLPLLLLAKALGTFVLLLAAPVTVVGQSRSAEKPNFLFILADDMGVHQLGCYGGTYYETPNIDRLATQGMRFTRAYSAAPICSPTRASLMTGKYPARVRVTDFIPGSNNWRNTKLLVPDWNKMLPTSETTIAEALKEAGYVSGHFGKWHLNIDRKNYLDRPGDPKSQGFDDVLTTYKPNEETNQNPDPQDDPHNARVITDRSIAFLEKNKDRPFFCYVSHNSIHRPEMQHPDRISKYENKAGVDNRDNRPVLAAMVEVLDSSIGRLLARLDQLGLSEKTVVIFFGDNGMFGDPDTLKPLRGAKGHLYEASFREPLVVRWPGKVKPGSVCDVPVLSNDFFPTLVEAAGLRSTSTDMDGLSLLPLFRQTGTLHRDALYFHYPHYSPQGGRPGGAVIAGRYKAIVWYEKEIDAKDPLDALELYDLEKDVGEQHNLVKTMPAKARELYQKFKQWQHSVDAQQMKLNSRYNPALPTTEVSD
jgi:arylsulfatase A-like enzyme